MIKINELYRLHKVDKEIGIEIEVEGNSLYTSDNRYWRVERDGSLRGNGFEYVLQFPINRNEVLTRLKYLKKRFILAKSRIRLSDRCGVHIHINCQEMTVKQVINYVFLYLLLEDFLVHFCGEDREGNLFCLRAKDATGLIEAIITCVKDQNFNIFQGDNYRYASINLGALSKYGSLEFRAMPTPEDFEAIKYWIDILLYIRDKSLQYLSPEIMIRDISRYGAKSFLIKNLGEYLKIIKYENMNEILDEILLDAIRRIQDIAYTHASKERPKKKKKRILDNNIARWDAGGALAEMNVIIRQDNPEPPPRPRRRPGARIIDDEG